MNIDEYREMVAREAESAKTDQTATPDPVAPVVPEPSKETVTDPTTVVTPEPETVAPSADKLIVDGEEVTLDDIREYKKGYLRQSDYTQKTQSVAAQRKEAAQAIALFEHLKANPHIAQAVLGSEATPVDVKGVFAPLDPNVARMSQMEQELFDLKLQREIDELQKKYPDFEVLEVLNKASEKQMNNLEDAYKLVKSEKPVLSVAPDEVLDKEQLKKDIRAQVLKELEDERASTSTLISSNDGNTVVEGDATLTAHELAILPKLGMTKEEYIKWKNPNMR